MRAPQRKAASNVCDLPRRAPGQPGSTRHGAGRHAAYPVHSHRQGRDACRPGVSLGCWLEVAFAPDPLAGRSSPPG
eukprot:scaffold160_cov264-Prasinococcus_capsulatus_cf.AAC.1